MWTFYENISKLDLDILGIDLSYPNEIPERSLFITWGRLEELKGTVPNVRLKIGAGVLKFDTNI